MSSRNEQAELYIFPPSTGCEVAAWLLERYQIPTRIKSHTAPFFLIAIRLRGGKDYPLLIYRDEKISTSREVASFLEATAPADKKLAPADAALAKAAKEFWNETVNPKLANAVARWAYPYLLPHKSLTYGPITKGVPGWEKLFAWLFYRPIGWLISKALNLRENPVEEKVAMIREVYDRVDAMLADGREYLYGDTPCYVDFGFAGLAGPTTLEPQYGKGGLLPALEDAPEEMQALVLELRQRPAGKLVRKLYRQFR